MNPPAFPRETRVVVVGRAAAARARSGAEERVAWSAASVAAICARCATPAAEGRTLNYRSAARWLLRECRRGRSSGGAQHLSEAQEDETLSPLALALSTNSRFVRSSLLSFLHSFSLALSFCTTLFFAKHANI